MLTNTRTDFPLVPTTKHFSVINSPETMMVWRPQFMAAKSNHCFMCPSPRNFTAGPQSQLSHSLLTRQADQQWCWRAPKPGEGFVTLRVLLHTAWPTQLYSEFSVLLFPRWFPSRGRPEETRAYCINRAFKSAACEAQPGPHTAKPPHHMAALPALHLHSTGLQYWTGLNLNCEGHDPATRLESLTIPYHLSAFQLLQSPCIFSYFLSFLCFYLQTPPVSHLQMPDITCLQIFQDTYLELKNRVAQRDKWPFALLLLRDKYPEYHFYLSLLWYSTPKETKLKSPGIHKVFEARCCLPSWLLRMRSPTVSPARAAAPARPSQVHQLSLLWAHCIPTN